MRKKLMLISFVLSLVFVFTAGCANTPGSHYNVRQQPNSSQALQSVGILAGQLSGNKASPQKRNEALQGLGALGTLMDFMGQ